MKKRNEKLNRAFLVIVLAAFLLVPLRTAFAAKGEEKIEDLAGRYREAQALFELQKFPEAADAYQKILWAKPPREMAAEASYRMGECYYNLEQFERSVEVFKSILKKYKDLYLAPEALYALGLSYLALGDRRNAEVILSGKLAESFPGYAQAEKTMDGLGMIRYADGDYRAAAVRFEGLKSKESLFYLAKCWGHLGKPLEAVGIYKQLIDAYPGTVLAEMSMYSEGDALFYSREYQGALYKYEYFLTRYPMTRIKDYVRYKLGCCTYHEKNYEKAIELFIPEVKHADAALAAHNSYMLGEACFATKRMDRAIVAYQRVRANYPTSRVAALASLKLGRTFVAKGDTNQAQIVYEQLANQYPSGDFAGLGDYLSGANLFDQGRFAEAAQHFEIILEKYSTSLAVEPALAMDLMAHNKEANYEKTIAVGSTYLKRLPESKSPWRGRSYYFLAEAYFYTRDYADARKFYIRVRDEYGESGLTPEALNGVGWCLLQEGKYDAAIQELQKVEAGWGTDTSAVISAKFGKGIAQYNLAEYLKALDELESLERDYAGNETAGAAVFYTGLCYYRMEYYAQSLRTWESVLNNYKKNHKAPDAAMQMGETYFRALQYDKAIASYRTVLDDYPTSPLTKDAQMSIANCYYNARQDDDAIREYQKFRDLHPRDSMAVDALKGIQASYYRKGQKHPEVLREFVERFSSTDLAAEAQYSLAQKEFSSKDYSKAIEDFRKVVVDFPKSTWAPQSQAAMTECYRLQGDYKGVVDASQKFIEYFPEDKQAPELATALGAAYYNLGDYRSAAEAFGMIPERFPTSDRVGNAFTNMAVCYRKLGRPVDAIDALQRFITKFPSDPKVVQAGIQIGAIYEEQGDHQKAISTLSGITPPTDEAACELYARLGDAYRNASRAEDAIGAYSRLLRVNVMDNSYKLGGLAQLALLYEKAGRIQEAQDAYSALAASTTRAEVKSAAQRKISNLKIPTGRSK